VVIIFETLLELIVDIPPNRNLNLNLLYYGSLISLLDLSDGMVVCLVNTNKLN